MCVCEYVWCERETETPMERDTHKDTILTQRHTHTEVQRKRNTEWHTHIYREIHTFTQRNKKETQ